MINFKYYPINQKNTIEYINFNDFFKNALLTEYIVLKEEKETVLFFNILNNKQKNYLELKITLIV